MEIATSFATLGGGCFWCLEGALRQLAGVESVISGYCGGHTENPDYRAICEGNSGHVEVVRITFDPAVIDYTTLLEAFFSIHDPTTPNRQGNDVGTQYRSAIFTHGPEQERIATEMIRQLDAAKIWRDPIVTAVSPAPTFWPAETYHQDYLANNPNQPYCRAIVAPKAAKVRTKYAERLKPRG